MGVEWVVSMSFVWVAACVVFSACFDTPMDSTPSDVQLIAQWDTGSCDPPHRIAIDLSDAAGDAVSRSAPCDVGTMTIDVPQLGTYTGRVYAWKLGSGSGSGSDAEVAVEVDVDASVTRWDLGHVP